MSLLQVRGLQKKYGGRQVVKDVSFEVGAGEVVGLLGPNGAGKTTSFRMTCGMVTPDRGQVILDGKNVTDWPMHLRARQGGLGYLPQQTSVFCRLTVEQNLIATMQLLGVSRSEQKTETERLIQGFGLEKYRHTLSSKVSGGEQRRLEIARCLISKPKVIMLDEPFAGIDPVTVESIQGIIQDLAKSGIGVLITDHSAMAILQITSRTYVIFEGAVMCSGSADFITNHPEVRRIYLGANAAVFGNPVTASPAADHGASAASWPSPAPGSAPLGAQPSSNASGPGPANVANGGQPHAFPLSHAGPLSHADVASEHPGGSFQPQGDTDQDAESIARGSQVPRPKLRQRFFGQPKTMRESQSQD